LCAGLGDCSRTYNCYPKHKKKKAHVAERHRRAGRLFRFHQFHIVPVLVAATSTMAANTTEMMMTAPLTTLRIGARRRLVRRLILVLARVRLLRGETVSSDVSNQLCMHAFVDAGMVWPSSHHSPHFEHRLTSVMFRRSLFAYYRVIGGPAECFGFGAIGWLNEQVP